MKEEMDKYQRHGIFMIIYAIFTVMSVIGGIWGIIEGIDYFVNDNPVDWTPIWIGIAALLGGLITLILSILNISK